MCVAVPGKVLSTDGIIGKIEIRGNILTVQMGFVKAEPGDYVLVHAGCAIEVMKKSQAEEILELLTEMESLVHGQN